MLAHTAGGHHTGCPPSLLPYTAPDEICLAPWPRGALPGKEERGPNTANTPTCIAPASSRAAALLRTQQPARHVPGSGRVRAHPPPEPVGARAAGESWQPCKQPSRGATSICWATRGLEPVRNLIRLCDMADLFRDWADGGLGAWGMPQPRRLSCIHAPRGYRLLPFIAGPQIPLPQCWGDPWKEIPALVLTCHYVVPRGTAQAIERGQRINGEKNEGRSPQKKDNPPYTSSSSTHALQLLFRNELVLPYLQPPPVPGHPAGRHPMPACPVLVRPCPLCPVPVGTAAALPPCPATDGQERRLHNGKCEWGEGSASEKPHKHPAGDTGAIFTPQALARRALINKSKPSLPCPAAASSAGTVPGGITVP